MWNNVIGRHIHRSNRNLLVFNSLMLSALLLWALASSRYLYNCLRGPQLVIDDDLAQVVDPMTLRRYFVRVEGLQPVYRARINVGQSRRYRKRQHEVAVNKGRNAYLAAHFGKLIVIIRSGSASLEARYQAALVPLPADVRVWFERNRPAAGAPSSDGVLLPYLLDATDFRRNAVFGFVIFGPIGLLAGCNATKALQRMAHIEASPIYKQLQYFNHEAERVGWSIHRELKKHGDSSPMPAVAVTPSWFLQSSLFGLDVVNFKEVVWIYQTCQHFDFYVLTLADERGRRVSVTAGSLSKDSLDALMEIVVQRAPWAITGYSRELRRFYANDRHGFIAKVDERRHA